MRTLNLQSPCTTPNLLPIRSLKTLRLNLETPRTSPRTSLAPNLGTPRQNQTPHPSMGTFRQNMRIPCTSLPITRYVIRFVSCHLIS
ncbi:hypothetical protein L208DRAFT_677975 [Tricholoma matsutake]|nr:hypothetical protein L208DRAFT_677975 [Tricholoma matsutake 945]